MSNRYSSAKMGWNKDPEGRCAKSGASEQPAQVALGLNGADARISQGEAKNRDGYEFDFAH